MEKAFVISDFTETDRKQVEDCIVDLQEHERKIDLNKRPGQDVSVDYLKYLERECKDNDGKIFVAKINDQIVGFTCIWVVDEDDPTSNTRKIGYFSDLYTKPLFRRKGVGAGLLFKGKSYINSLGINVIRICTLANNLGIQETLKSQGFAPYEITWEIS